MKTILLVCSAGASSGFIAKNIRKAVKERGLDYTVIARSEAEIEDYIEDVDMILVGPHLKYMIDDLKAYTTQYGVGIYLIDKKAYGNMDANSIIDFIESVMKRR